MRIVIVGQQAFGKAVLDAFLERGDTVAGVFAAPEKPGARPDPLVAAAEEKKLPVYRFPKYSAPEAIPVRFRRRDAHRHRRSAGFR